MSNISVRLFLSELFVFVYFHLFEQRGNVVDTMLQKLHINQDLPFAL